MTHGKATRQATFKVGVCHTASCKTRSWSFGQADLVQRTGLQKEETSVSLNRHLVLLNLKGNSERGDYTVDGRRVGFVRRKPGALLFIPAGCNWRGWEAGASTAAYLSISVEPGYVSNLFREGSAGALPSLSADLGFKDPIIMSAAHGIATEISDRNPLSAMLVESYVATIFAQLMRKQRYVQPISKGGLTSIKLTRVIEAIEDDLATNLSLAQLAELVDLSVPHFCRAFRQVVGCPPHTFILQRRIERATDFLRCTSQSVTDIALSCGFSSSSHFSNAFRRALGISPIEYRASWPGRMSN